MTNELLHLVFTFRSEAGGLHCGIPISKGCFHPGWISLPYWSNVLYPELNFLCGNLLVFRQHVRNTDKHSSKVFVDYFRRSRPMAVSQAIGVEAKLFQLIEHKGVIGFFIKQWTKIVKFFCASSS